VLNSLWGYLGYGDITVVRGKSEMRKNAGIPDVDSVFPMVYEVSPLFGYEPGNCKRADR
jgi:hypothetical protein